MLEDRLWKSANWKDQVMQTSATCVICHYRNATFWTVPKCLMDFHILISGAVMFPLTNPIFEHLSSITISNRDLFYSINFKRRSVQHFFDGARSRFENCQSNHLIQSYLRSLLLDWLIIAALSSRLVSFLLKCLQSIGIISTETWRLTQEMFLRCVL